MEPPAWDANAHPLGPPFGPPRDRDPSPNAARSETGPYRNATTPQNSR